MKTRREQWLCYSGNRDETKQDKLGDGPGSLIRLPFGVHRKDGNRYGFVHPSGKRIRSSVQEQIQLLSQPQTVSEAAFDEFWRPVNDN